MAYLHEKIGTFICFLSLIFALPFGFSGRYSYDSTNFVFYSPWRFEGKGVYVKLLNAGIDKLGYDIESPASQPTSYISYCSISGEFTDPWCGIKTLLTALLATFSCILSISNFVISLSITLHYKLPTWDGAGKYYDFPILICLYFLKFILLTLVIITWYYCHQDIHANCISSSKGLCLSFQDAFIFLICDDVLTCVIIWTLRLSYQWKVAKYSGKIVDQFILAVKLDDVDEILAAIANNIDIDMNGSDGRNALHWTCTMNHSSTCHILLKKGASISKKDKDGWTALHWASRMGNSDIVRLLAKYGADINTKDLWGSTALMLTVVGGSKSAAQTLLELGAEIDAKNVFGQTCLMLCAEEGSSRRSFVVLLTKLGASVHIADNHGMNALHYAASTGDKYVLQNLLECADPELYAVKNKFNETPLDEAILRGRSSAEKLLFEWATGEPAEGSDDESTDETEHSDGNSASSSDEDDSESDDDSEEYE